MATSSGAVQFDLKANTKPFLQEAESAASQVKSMFSGLKSVLGKTFTVGALLDFGKRCTEAASELIELQNVVEQVFPTMSDRVDEWSQNLIQSFGLSEAKAKHYAGTMASMARSMGFTEEQAYAMSTSLAELSGDIASFYDMSSDEAYDKLTSIFTGVTQPLRSLGINMTEATLNAFALAHGFERTYQEMDEAERTLLRYQFVLDRTQFAQGDAARTSNSWANQLRQLQMNFESLQATLGEQFVNALLPALQTINSIVIALDNLAQRIDIVGMALNGLAGMLPGLNRAALANGLVNRTSGLNKVLSKTNKISAAAAESTAGLASAQTGAAGSAGSQGRATEKLNRILAGFDRINKLASAHSSGGGAGGGGGGGGSFGGIGSDLLDELLGTEGAKISGWNKYDLKHANRAGSADSFMFKYAKRYGTTTIASDLKDIWSNKDSDIFSKLQKSAQAIGKMLQERIKGGGVQRQLNRAGGSTLGRGIAGNVLGKSIGVDIDGLGGLAEAWNSITDKTAKLTATTAGNDKVDTLKKSYDGIKDKNAKIGFQYSGDLATWKSSWQNRVNKAFYNRTAAAGKSSATNGTAPAIGYRYSNTYDAWKSQWASRVKAFYSLTEYNSANKYNSAPSISYRFTNTAEAWKKQWNNRIDYAFPSKTATVYLQTKLAGVRKATIKNSWTGQDLAGLEVAPSAWFAQGGWVARNTPRLAVIGDNTREGEIVSPESKFQTMLDKAAGQNNDAETVRMLGLILQAVQGIDSNVYIDSRDVTRAVVSNINRQVQSTGRSPLIV
jgi:hypothetical protein